MLEPLLTRRLVWVDLDEDKEEMGLMTASRSGPRRAAAYAMVALLALAASLAVCAGSAFAAVTAPSIEDESVTDVSSTSATLQATINPEESATSYRFEYGASGSYGSDAPQAEGLIAAGTAGVVVEVHIQGLTPSSVYHYRVTAANEAGSTSGADAAFTTESLGGPLTLLDGRQWELVSPPNKHGALIEAGREEGGAIQAAADGSGIAYYASAPVTGEEVGSRSPEQTEVLSKRGADGWSSEDLSVRHEEGNNVAVGAGGEYKAFSSNLSLGILEPADFAHLAAETTEWTPYLRDNLTAALTPLLTAANVPAGTKFAGESSGRGVVRFEAASPDLKHVILASSVALTENASEYGLYEWFEGKLELVSVLPGAEENPARGGSSAGLYVGDSEFGRGRDDHAVSNDGSVIFIGEGHLYLRDVALRQTVQLDIGGESGRSQFWTASADGSRIFFTDYVPLTPGATGSNLYQCSVTIVAGRLTCELSDLTPGMQVSGVIGASEDGSYVYVMNGEDEIYEEHAGTATLVSPIGPVSPGYFSGAELTARVSPNGRFLAFMSTLSLTGYDNRDAASGALDTEVYLYDAASRNLTCVSCNPTGARPQGLHILKGAEILVDSRGEFPAGTWLSGSVPGWVGIGAGAKLLHQPRYLSNSGQVFFNSAEALVPQDVNGLEDVYEYEPDGTGSCQAGGGCTQLISSGSSQEESVFMDASESGGDAFFVTSTPLVAKDYDQAFDMYDAHVCSAEAPCASEPVPPPPCESGDSCKGAPSPQPTVFGSPASATFSGVGNLVAPVVKSAKGGSQSAAKARAKRKLRHALKLCAAEHKGSPRKRKLCEQRARRRLRDAVRASSQHRKGKATRRGNGR